jgi:hypothetical protein
MAPPEYPFSVVIGFADIPVIFPEFLTARILSNVAYPDWRPEPKIM